MISARNTFISLILGLLANIISGYLFYLGVINFNLLLFFIVGSIFVVVIIITQTNNYEIEGRLANQEREQRNLGDKLKIYELLIDMKAGIKELKRGY